MVNTIVSLDLLDGDQLMFFARKADHTMGLIGFLKAQLGIPRAGVQPVRAIFRDISSTARLLIVGALQSSRS
jgi:hypothetical protein